MQYLISLMIEIPEALCEDEKENELSDVDIDESEDLEVVLARAEACPLVTRKRKPG